MRTTLGNMGKAFEKMKIISELQQVKGTSMLALQLQIGVRLPETYDEIIENMRQQLVDNYEGTAAIIGEKAAQLILKY